MKEDKLCAKHEQSGKLTPTPTPVPGGLVTMGLGDDRIVTSYAYDAAGQLLEAIDGETDQIYRYTYDSSGNIRSAKTYAYDDDGNEVLSDSKTFSYTGGILTSYTHGNATFSYQIDAMGNPVQIRKGSIAETLNWGEGRMLLGVSVNASNHSEYTYNVDGLRTKKVAVVNGATTTTEYVWGDNGLAGAFVQNATEKNIVVLHYDSEGEVIGFTVKNTPIPKIRPASTATYTYVKNLQGDVLRILDMSGEAVVSYTYDPWGKPTVTGDENLAALNPCSYRGYDYDEETGYYYLQSRYYDPTIGRFVNADEYDYLGSSDSLLSFNLYSYCNNQPIIYADPTGHAIVIVVCGVTLTIEAILVYCAVATTLYMLLMQLVRELPRILSAIGKLVDGLFAALQKVIVKAQKTYERYGYNVHHIIARNAGGAKEARTIWTQRCKMSIENSRNKAKIKTTFHLFLHTSAYYKAVNKLVKAGYSYGKTKGVLEVVSFIRTTLLAISAYYF